MLRNLFNKMKDYKSDEQVKQTKSNDSMLKSFQENNQKYQRQKINQRRPIRMINFKSKYNGTINSNNVTNNFYLFLVKITIPNQDETDHQELLDENKKIEDNKN